jgi:hypothetical protein
MGQEVQATAAEVDHVVRADRFHDEPVVVLGDPAHARRRRDHPRVRHRVHRHAQAAVVVRLHMVHHDQVDLRRVDDLGHAGDELTHERPLDRIDERDLLAPDDEIRVVGRAARRLVAVEIAQVPVDAADPVDAVRDGDRSHRVPP